MSKKISYLLSLLLCLLYSNLSAQKPDTAFFKAKSICLLNQYKAISGLEGSKKIQAETAFRDSLAACLELTGSFNYTFDTLKNIGRIQSDDNKLTVFSWNIPQKSGYSNYYCLLQYYSKKDKQIFVYTLTEEPGLLKKNPQAFTDISHWPGVLYYKIIDTKFKGKVYYTLLGFNFNDILSNIKTIDVLTFDEFNYPGFGQKMFVYNGKPQNRIVYEYNERAQMMLEYNENLKLIVADHLSPARPSMEGQYQFYGPDFSYEGFSFEDGIWQHRTEVDIRN